MRNNRTYIKIYSDIYYILYIKIYSGVPTVYKSSKRNLSIESGVRFDGSNPQRVHTLKENECGH